MLPLSKTSHDVTFSIQSIEIEEDKKSSSTSQSDNNILESPATPKKHFDPSNGNGYSNLKKKLAEQ